MKFIEVPKSGLYINLDRLNLVTKEKGKGAKPFEIRFNFGLENFTMSYETEQLRDTNFSKIADILQVMR